MSQDEKKVSLGPRKSLLEVFEIVFHQYSFQVVVTYIFLPCARLRSCLQETLSFVSLDFTWAKLLRLQATFPHQHQNRAEILMKMSVGHFCISTRESLHSQSVLWTWFNRSLKHVSLTCATLNLCLAQHLSATLALHTILKCYLTALLKWGSGVQQL